MATNRMTSTYAKWCLFQSYDKPQALSRLKRASPPANQSYVWPRRCCGGGFLETIFCSFCFASEYLGIAPLVLSRVPLEPLSGWSIVQRSYDNS